MFTARQGIAIAIQETAFLAGLAAADRMAVILKQRFGNNKTVDYTAAALSGALGSLAGHPANTFLTLSQSGMPICSVKQLFLGAARKSRAMAVFSALYKFGKETLNSTVEFSKE